MNPLQSIYLHMRAHPDSIAIQAGSQFITYKELWEYAQRVRPSMAPQGAVVLQYPNPIDYVARFVALLADYKPAGSLSRTMAIPIPPGMNPERVQMLRDRIVLAHGAVLHMTSGSSGVSRFVPRSLENLESEAEGVAKALSLRPGMIVLITTPFEHSLGCGILRAALCAGATVRTFNDDDPNGEFATPKWTTMRSMALEGADVIVGVPYSFQRMLKGWPTGHLLSYQTQCYAGGEFMPTWLQEAWWQTTGSQLRQEYGLSEGGIVSFATATDPRLSIGRPISGVELWTDSDGELIVRREHSPSRYYFDESPETFLGNGQVRTGDIGYGVGLGAYYLEGRKKDIIVIAGMKVTPLEIETALMNYPDIETAVVMSRPHPEFGNELVAFVDAYQPDGTSNLKGYLRGRLESYKVPRHFIYILDWPRTVSGKIDRVKLRSML